MSAAIQAYSAALMVLLGIAVNMASKRLRIPPILTLILAGASFSHLAEACRWFEVPAGFVRITAILAVVMIVFDIFSRIDARFSTSIHAKVTQFKLIYAILALPIITGIAYVSTGNSSVALLVLFSSLLLTAKREAGMPLPKKNSKVEHFMKIEGYRSTGLAVFIIAVVAVYLQKMQNTDALGNTYSFAYSYAGDLLSGLGAGIFVGLIVFRIMRKWFHEITSNTALLASLLLAYASAGMLGSAEAAGILAVIAIGLFYGSTSIRGKASLYEFSGTAAELAEVLVPFLAGMMIRIPFSSSILAAALIVFITLMVIRYAALWLSFRGAMNAGERALIALSRQMDISTLAMLLFISLIADIKGFEHLAGAIMMVVIFSVGAAYFTCLFLREARRERM